MLIIRNSESVFVEKQDGTSVNYYMLPEYEIHYNSVTPGCVQVWHRHDKIEEIIFILEGEITAVWIDELGKKKESLLAAKDMVVTKKSFHTFENRSNKECKFIVIKLVLSGQNNQEVFKTDKLLS